MRYSNSNSGLERGGSRLIVLLRYFVIGFLASLVVLHMMGLFPQLEFPTSAPDSYATSMNLEYSLLDSLPVSADMRELLVTGFDFSLDEDQAAACLARMPSLRQYKNLDRRVNEIGSKSKSKSKWKSVYNSHLPPGLRNVTHWVFSVTEGHSGSTTLGEGRFYRIYDRMSEKGENTKRRVQDSSKPNKMYKYEKRADEHPVWMEKPVLCTIFEAGLSMGDKRHCRKKDIQNANVGVSEQDMFWARGEKIRRTRRNTVMKEGEDPGEEDPTAMHRPLQPYPPASVAVSVSEPPTNMTNDSEKEKKKEKENGSRSIPMSNAMRKGDAGANGRLFRHPCGVSGWWSEARVLSLYGAIPEPFTDTSVKERHRSGSRSVAYVTAVPEAIQGTNDKQVRVKMHTNEDTRHNEHSDPTVRQILVAQDSNKAEILCRGHRRAYHYVRDKLLPLYASHTVKKCGDDHGIVFVDLGHHSLFGLGDALVSVLGAQHVTFVRIRRPRSEIALSYLAEHKWPCNGEGMFVLCPWEHGSLLLQRVINARAKWSSLNAYQKLLWLSDEVEYRWRLVERHRTMRKQQRKGRRQTGHHHPISGPNLLSVEWSSVTAHGSNSSIVQAHNSIAQMFATVLPQSRKAHVSSEIMTKTLRDSKWEVETLPLEQLRMHHTGLGGEGRASSIEEEMEKKKLKEWDNEYETIMDFPKDVRRLLGWKEA